MHPRVGDISAGTKPARHGDWLYQIEKAGHGALPWVEHHRARRPARNEAAELAIYREAADGAHDPEGWDYLRRVLHAWRARAIAVRQPGFYEAEEAARDGTGDGMPLEDYLRERRCA